MLSPEKHIRPFTQDDIAQVTSLHWQVWGTKGVSLPANIRAEYDEYFRDIFLDGQAGDPRMSSKVYEESTGHILGFIGVVTRTMSLGERPLLAALGSQLIVDPVSRYKLVGVHLVKNFLDGPQDLSIADESNDAGRRVWEKMGGTTAMLSSLSWVRALRPMEYLAESARQRAVMLPLARAFVPVARVMDSALARITRLQLRGGSIVVQESGELDGHTVATHFAKFMGPDKIIPTYQNPLFDWLLRRASSKGRYGQLKAVTVKTNLGQVLGWYVYYAKRSGISEVVHLVASHNNMSQVFNHLIHHAWEERAVALTGRLDPAWLDILTQSHCWLHKRGPSLCVHSKHSDLLEHIRSDRWFSSRLDGEWCVRFR